MRTFAKTGFVLLALLAGITTLSATSALSLDESAAFGSYDFWSSMGE